MKLTRSVGGQIPTGFDVTKWGIPADMADSVDRVGLWNIVATVDAFLTGGFTPSELLRWVHPRWSPTPRHRHGRHDLHEVAVHRHAAR